MQSGKSLATNSQIASAAVHGGMPDANQLRELLQKSGFSEVRVAQQALPVSLESAARLGATLARQ
jgi:hypothetical protein